MNIWLISDTHLNHQEIATYCDRPENFTELIITRWNQRVKPDDLVIHLGDVAIGKHGLIEPQLRALNGKKILIRGNHDKHHGCHWWMNHGFDFACDAMVFRNCWLTHKPAKRLPRGCTLNIHGHLHNVWDTFSHMDDGVIPWLFTHILRRGRLRHSWQRLFAIEYTDYYPIGLEEFLAHPDKYRARSAE